MHSANAAGSRSAFLASFLFCLILIAEVSAQEYAPGLVLGFRSLSATRVDSSTADGGAPLLEDRRVARLVGLHVPEGKPYSPFLNPGRFRATWSGFIEIDRRDRYTFSFEGVGELELRIDGKQVFTGSVSTDHSVSAQALRLKKGRHPFLLSYSSPASGPATLRLAWSSRKFGVEPVPPNIFVHHENPALHTLREGRRLFADRSCISCHLDPVRFAKGSMPELAKQGPDFLGIGSRLHGAWLAEWIEDPRALRPDARMPKLLHRDFADANANDIAAWLSSLTAEQSPSKSSSQVGDPSQGGVLWKELGCFSCHSRAGEVPELGFVSLVRVNEKFKGGALAAFLLAPRKHGAWTRMPDFRLDASEAADLAAFLRRGQKAGSAIPGDPAKGHIQALANGCGACHSSSSIGGEYSARPLAELRAVAEGCLSTDQSGLAPDFGFTATERAQLIAFLDRGRPSLARTCPPEFAARQLRERRCDACHQLDGRSAAWITRADKVVDLPDRPLENGHVEVAQNRPPLTFLGEKLQAGYLEKIIAGKSPSPRPWLRARMPAFPVIASDLAEGLAAQHGFSTAALPATGREFVVLGEKLAHAKGGFACIMCHGLGERAPTALFEVRGINLAVVGERLRPGYYRRWMADPMRLDSASKMPRYSTADGKTAFDDFGGDAEKQFHAIWQYLRQLR